MSTKYIDTIHVNQISPSGEITNVEYKLRDSDAQLSLKNLLKESGLGNILYPVGTVYWTSNKDFDPNQSFGGKWIRLEDTFIYAAKRDDKVYPAQDIEDNSATLIDLYHGANKLELTIDNLPSHSHSVNDPGHNHSIRTYGDDYDGWTNGSQGVNFKHDGHSDMTNQNTGKGIEAVKNTTGITIGSTGNNVPINNMPKHIYRYCWEKVSDANVTFTSELFGE